MNALVARLGLLAAVVLAGLAVAALARPAPAQAPRSGGASRSAPAAEGGAIFADACSTCHGDDARGIAGRGPSLRGVGAAAVDFYVSTGRMPLARPGLQPERAQAVYTPREVRALSAYLTALPAAGGPLAPRPGGPVPDVDPARGDVVDGRRLFADSCSGCHQIMTQGGIGTGFYAPKLSDATPTQIGEAIRIGPYVMPRFSEAQLTPADVDSIARYVTEIGQDPPDRGGWGIGNIGPVPEGLAVLLLGMLALVGVARLIGERAR